MVKPNDDLRRFLYDILGTDGVEQLKDELRDKIRRKDFKRCSWTWSRVTESNDVELQDMDVEEELPEDTLQVPEVEEVVPIVKKSNKILFRVNTQNQTLFEIFVDRDDLRSNEAMEIAVTFKPQISHTSVLYYWKKFKEESGLKNRI